MISYRTILFGTIAVLSAAAPAVADSAHALPLARPMDSAHALPLARPMDSAHALPLLVMFDQGLIEVGQTILRFV